MKKAETIIPIKIMARTLKLIAIFVADSHCRLQICEGVFALLGSKSGKFREGNGITLRSVMNMVSTLCGTSYPPSVEFLPFPFLKVFPEPRTGGCE